jgi:hypothetical protein
MTLEELKKLYAEKGGTEKRYTDTEQGRTEEDVPIQYGDGWAAWENDNRKIIDYIGQGMDAQPVYDNAPKTLGGFSKQEGDYITDYDLNGNPVARRKWNESTLKTMWNDLGPIAMAALTMGGGAGALGKSLFGLTGTAASGAGGALAGGFNAAMNDQNILKGALMGGAGSAGALQLGDTGLTLGDATKAANAIKNKDALGLLSSSAGLIDTSGFDLNGMSATDIAKYANIAKGLTSGGAGTVNALASLSKDQGFNNLMSSIGPGTDKEFSEGLIPGYFLPGGEGYVPSKLNQTYGPTETFDPSQTDWAALYADKSNGSPAGVPVSTYKAQDFGTDPNKYWDEYMNAMNQASNKDGFTSGWQTLGTNRVMIQDDGTAIILDPTTQQTSFLTEDQVNALVKNGSLNTADSGYVAATGGTGNTPGGSGAKTVTPAAKTTTPTTTPQQLGGSQQAQLPSQDPYADIKYMEELFGKDMAYKLQRLGANPKQQTASSNIDALAKLLKG